VLRSPIRWGDADFVVTGSVGIAFTRALTADPHAAVSDADIALHQAKRSGGNRYRLFDEQMRRDLSGRVELEAGLRRALDREELHLHYQPEFTCDGRLVGFEALIRWRHPTLGDVAPSQFVPVAEESALIIPIGRWALEAACRQAHRWNSGRAGAALSVSVNVSALQLRDAFFLESVAAALACSGLAARHLILEITESVLMEDSEHTIAVLHALRDLGVRLAVDDFGTGYSSLGYLSELPIDFLKVDRRFVDGIGTRSSSENITRAVIQLAHALELEVIAEGIERPEQLQWLRAQRCDIVQGFHLGRPAPAQDHDELVAEADGPLTMRPGGLPRPTRRRPGGDRAGRVASSSASGVADPIRDNYRAGNRIDRPADHS
jgi:EAL domain-containing protein (putative c-di-GMP-specific phosphodiesterase class I)